MKGEGGGWIVPNRVSSLHKMPRCKGRTRSRCRPSLIQPPSHSYSSRLFISIDPYPPLLTQGIRERRPYLPRSCPRSNTNQTHETPRSYHVFIFVELFCVLTFLFFFPENPSVILVIQQVVMSLSESVDRRKM